MIKMSFLTLRPFIKNLKKAVNAYTDSNITYKLDMYNKNHGSLTIYGPIKDSKEKERIAYVLYHTTQVELSIYKAENGSDDVPLSFREHIFIRRMVKKCIKKWFDERDSSIEKRVNKVLGL
jgi:hypothetical protein